MRDKKIITGASGKVYLEAAGRLQHQCESIGLSMDILPYADTGSWVGNCLMKPTLILEAMQEGIPLLWIDADARLCRDACGTCVDPWTLLKPGDVTLMLMELGKFIDVPGHVLCRFYSHVIGVNPTEQATQFTQKWKRLCDEVTDGNSSDHLQLNMALQGTEGDLTVATCCYKEYGRAIQGMQAPNRRRTVEMQRIRAHRAKQRLSL